jgi:hypothetical protein
MRQKNAVGFALTAKCIVRFSWSIGGRLAREFGRKFKRVIEPMGS